ncbi:MAG: hypothetical protein A2Z83_01615 [Omnitrophica bacterium GWA2_52_8]|nr:MAG: hypothetical protein A2Z83_01615 [Omnitrophica bacterium GWA2_52_8]
MIPKKNILVIDDDPMIREVVSETLSAAGYEVREAASGAKGLEHIAKQKPHLVFLDIRIGATEDGLVILQQIKKKYPELAVIMMSAHGTIKTALRSIKLGAYDYLEKPFELEDLELKAKLYFEKYELSEEVIELRRELGPDYMFKRIIGKSGAMEKVFDLMDVAAKSDINTLLFGESGTGKELIARAIHLNSDRKEGPFVAVNCMAIPDNLLESELFGHEKGAFTGAVQQRIGKFEQAQTGTIFLDEIGDLSMPLQGKLLRVLQEREVERVGGKEVVPIDVRFIFATHVDLQEKIRGGQFREDLFFRMHVLPIVIPPLRKRAEDIAELVMYFLEEKQRGKNPAQIEPAALEDLMRYSWPGNVRELENFIERILAIKSSEKPLVIRRSDIVALGHLTSQNTADDDAAGISEAETLNDAEKIMIRQALERHRQNVSKAAKSLSISRDTLYRKMRKYSIRA